MNNHATDIEKNGIQFNTVEQETSEAACIVLHKSENAWKPSYVLTHSIDEKEKLRRSVQGTLNRLTFEKFKILLSKIENLKFNKVEDLELLIDLIFENAIYEPYFCILYANLCKELSQIQLSIVDSSGQQVNFHEHLVVKCLKEFENCCIGQTQETLATSTEMNLVERRIQLSEEENRKMKRRQIGVVRFIGELFNSHVVVNATMHECIGKLLTAQDNKSLELVCEFFKTAGKELDACEMDIDKTFTEENRIDCYFAQMQTVVDNFLTNTRIRFMLQDVLDLRKNNWIPRRARIVPKTIDEIHKEVELDYHG